MRFFPFLVLAAGCAPSGIYMVTVPYTDGALTCDDTLDENFVDGFSPDSDTSGDSDWTITEDYTGADQVTFFHIAPTSGGGAVLTWGDSAFPGVADADGWTFSWQSATSSSYSAVHKKGYTYEESQESSTTTTIKIAQPFFADVTGTISGAGSSTHTWTESDKFKEADVGFNDGDIPSDTYLVYKDSGDLYPQSNMGDETDCKDSDCEITISSSCSQAGSSFTAKQIQGNDNLLYNDWKDDGQGSGDTGAI